jgi:hypothetical protein
MKATHFYDTGFGRYGYLRGHAVRHGHGSKTLLTRHDLD